MKGENTEKKEEETNELTGKAIALTDNELEKATGGSSSDEICPRGRHNTSIDSDTCDGCPYHRFPEGGGTYCDFFDKYLRSPGTVEVD